MNRSKHRRHGKLTLARETVHLLSHQQLGFAAGGFASATQVCGSGESAFGGICTTTTGGSAQCSIMTKCEPVCTTL